MSSHTSRGSRRRAARAWRACTLVFAALLCTAGCHSNAESDADATQAPSAAREVPAASAPVANPQAPQPAAQSGDEPAAKFGDRPGATVLPTLDANDERVQLYLVYGACRQRLEERKLAFVVENFLRERAQNQAGEVIAVRERTQPFASPAERATMLATLAAQEYERQRAVALDVDARVDAEYTRTMAEFAQRFPALDTLTEMRRSFRSELWYRSQLHWTYVFDGIFLPDDESQRPELTNAALRDAFGAQFASWQKPWRLADGSVDPRYQATVRQIVRDRLYEHAHFTTTLAGPAWNIALRADTDADGHADFELTTADAWKAVADTVNVQELEDARAFWRNVIATRTELEREGSYLSADARDVAFIELTNTLNDFVPTLETLALEQERFPSLEAYREYHGLEASFAQRFDALHKAAETTTPPELEQHYARSIARLGGVTVDADVLLVSAYDFPHARWNAEGRAGARTRAQALVERWRANESALAAGRADAREREAFWSALLDENSGWWDPPLPDQETAAELRAVERKRGRFGALDAARWLEMLEFTRLEAWLRGTAAFDAILRDAPIGELSGPFEHVYGELLVRVRSRSAPAQPLDLANPQHRGVLASDYVDQEFRAYTRRAVEHARAPAPGK